MTRALPYRWRTPPTAEGSAVDFTVTLSAASDADVLVNYATSDGTALVGDSDYTNTSGTLTIAAGNTSGTVSVPTTGDATVELDEDFTLTLSGLVNNGRDVTLTGATATGTITNDDTGATVSVADAANSGGLGCRSLQ